MKPHANETQMIPEAAVWWLSAVYLVLMVTVLCLWSAAEADLQKAERRLANLPTPYCPSANEQCPGWLFGSNLEQAKQRICKGYKQPGARK